MKTACPTCGAEVEFRYDDSFVRICDHCRAAVLRSDRGVETLGKVADLVPMESPLRLFADGHYGSASFILVGMAQIRHSAGGLWQEWYAKLDGGKWGWLAEAQGRLYLTFEEPTKELPQQLSFTPGSTAELPVNGKPRTFTVAEMGSATYVAAKGELPYRLVPDGSFRFVDLSDGAGTFATIDYGGEGDEPALYVGSQVTLADLGIRGGEVGPSTETAIKSVRLACPNCNGSLELRAPGQTQRIVCAYCNHLLDASSPTLAVIEKLASKATPAIPLGSKGTVLEGEMTVIGFVQRSAEVDGAWWPFDEYLLYEPKIGFRWLVQSDGHWSYVQPIAPGAVETDVNGAKYDGVKFRNFQTATLRVDQVLGEFYWQVHAGESVQSEDLIAPPAMLSREADAHEENWSLSTYMKVADVQHAFGDKDLPLGTPTGIAPNQPDSMKSASNVMAIAFVALMGLGILFSVLASDRRVASEQVNAPPASAIVAPKLDPQTIAECVDYKAGVDAASACDKIPAATRDSIKATYDQVVAGFASLTGDVAVQIATSCQAGTDATKQAVTGAGCPAPVAVEPLPPECVDFKTVAEGIQNCLKVPWQRRDEIKNQYQTDVASKASLSPDARGDLATTCKLDAAMVRESATLANCNLPAPSAPASVPATAAPELASNVFFTEPFRLVKGENIEVSFAASGLSNTWAYVAIDLVNETTGAVVTVDANVEYYFGYEDGESWSEGATHAHEVIGPQPSGTYIMRIETQTGASSNVPILVTVKQGVFRFKYLAWATLLLMIPLLLVGLVSWSHERTRWSNSSSGKAPFTPVALLIGTIGGVFTLIWLLIKAFGESSSNDDD